MVPVTRRTGTLVDKRPAPIQAISWNVAVRSYAWSPPTDVYETENSFVVRVEAAGMKGTDFTLEVEGNTLIIRGVRSDSGERRSYHQMEIRYGEFSTSVELPVNVDTDHAVADYEDGFLTILLPVYKQTGQKIQG